MRGERLALVRVLIDLTAGGESEFLLLTQLDRRDDLLERIVQFDADDLDMAVAELDHVQSEIDES